MTAGKCPVDHAAIRPELEKLPDRMATLPLDERGYPIPWFVDWIDGKPEFRAMDVKKWVEAIKFSKCWVCGNKLGRHKTFVAGPMCGINRTSSEPPSHRECAEWSMRNCPFLNNPEMTRREDAEVNKISGCIGGFAITRNPGVTLLWTTDTFDVFPDGKGGRLIRMGEPSCAEFYREGRPATRQEVIESIERGFPALAEMAMLQKGGMEYLAAARKRFEEFLPKE